MKNASRTKASVSLMRDRNLSNSSVPAATRPTGPAAKGAVTLFVSKSARSDMELVFDRLQALDKSTQSDTISGKGLAQFFCEVSVEASSLECMVLLWKLGATQQGCITRPEWLLSMYANGIESVAQLRQKLGEWVKDVRESSGTFLLMYTYMYDYIRGEEDRRMTRTTAINGWDVFFGQNKRYAKWKTWAVANLTGDVSRDLWRQLGIFLTMDTDATQSSDDQVLALSWPSAITDFIETDNLPAS
ncbi:putative Cullin binding [Leishmania utingensis]|uniref:Defective in cullin neddylation protein n=1 Tax=Leishmania utingensis TaxID=653362 RepID=A0AAW3AM58_9TRYP